MFLQYCDIPTTQFGLVGDYCLLRKTASCLHVKDESEEYSSSMSSKTLGVQYQTTKLITQKTKI
jgi:hypothetical protein